MSNSLLQTYDRTTTDFRVSAAVENNFDPIIDEIDDNTEHYFDKHEALQNDDKKSQLNEMIDIIRSGERGIIFKDEKAFPINLILPFVRIENGITISIDSSNIAATLLKLGCPAHSLFKLLNSLKRELLQYLHYRGRSHLRVYLLNC